MGMLNEYLTSGLKRLPTDSTWRECGKIQQEYDISFLFFFLNNIINNLQSKGFEDHVSGHGLSKYFSSCIQNIFHVIFKVS